MIVAARWRAREQKRRRASAETTALLMRLRKWALIGLALAFVAVAVVSVYVIGLPGDNDPVNEGAAGWQEMTDSAPDKQVSQDRMRTVIRSFLEAPSLEERVPYVREPDRVRPLMEDYYRRHPDGPIDFQGLAPTNMIRRQSNRLTGVTFVTWPVVMPDFSSRGLALEVSGAPDAPDYRVDWESFVVYSEMEWDAFVAGKPEEPVLFRVLASPGTYFNYDFSDRKEHVCLKITDGRGIHTLYGYIPRDAPLATRMKELFPNRRTIRAMVIRLKFPPQPRSDNQVEISDLADTQWVPGLGGGKESE